MLVNLINVPLHSVFLALYVEILDSCNVVIFQCYQGTLKNVKT